ncbi:hypothetical protein GCM10022236_13230 [Microlunatus ginsengisoli]|uniref:Uncharacterized protein n=1 Tax=Microlunatus ginsengisoli TaxID=363863 RepID=A0ABP6ZN57_9ACTN
MSPRLLGAPAIEDRVHVEHRRIEDPIEACRRDELELVADKPIHFGRCYRAQVSRAGRHLPGLPGVHLAGGDPGPQPGQAVSQVQGVRDQTTRGSDGQLLKHAELGRTGLGDPRSAGSAWLDEALVFRPSPPRRLGVLRAFRPIVGIGVRIRPGCGNDEPAALVQLGQRMSVRDELGQARAASER